MEKKRRKLYMMFTKWSLSYVILSTVAIIVIFFCTRRYSDVLQADQEYTNAVQLEVTQFQMDWNVKNLRTLCSTANLSSTVSKLRQQTSYADVPRYDVYELVRELASLKVTGSGTSDSYLYFPTIDLLVSGSYYNTSEIYYDVAFGNYNVSYEDWMEIISKVYRSAQIFTLKTKQEKEITVLIKPLDSSNRQIPPVNAILIMDLNDILKGSEWLNQDRDVMCVIDHTNDRMVSSAPLSKEVEEWLQKYITGGHNREEKGRFVIGSSVVSCIPSQYENWEYVVVTQEQKFVQQMKELQSLVLFLVLLYLAISVIVVCYVIFRHYRPIQNVMDILEQQEGISDQQMSSDAYEYISKSVHKLVDKNKENSDVILRQRNAIGRELFHRLLTESKAYAMIDERLLEQHGIQVEEKAFCILAYRMEQEGSRLLEEASQDARKMSWFILQNVTEENLIMANLKAVCFMEGDLEQIFLIWQEEEEEIRDGVNRVWRDSTEFIRTHFNFLYQIALSELHQGTKEIYQAYREVERIFDYQKTEDGKEVVSYGEINLLPVDTMLRYPIDVENRLSHSVSTGDGEGACQEIRRLLEENQVNCLSPEAMQFLVSNIASTITRAAGKVSKETALPISQKALLEACRQGKLGKMQEELERLAVTACQETLELNKKEKENQKGKLYLDTKAYVEECYSNAELSVNFMAEHFGVQPTYLSKLFKEMEGEKLSQYIHKVRLTHVKELLMEGVRLEEIAARCGFGSQRTFLRIFKQYEGVTPTQFKELEEKKGKEEREL